MPADDKNTPLLDKGPDEDESLRKKVFQVVEGEGFAGRVFLLLSFGLTVMSFGIFAANTEPSTSSWFMDEQSRARFESLEVFTILFFTLEYILRCWTMPELKEDAAGGSGADFFIRVVWAFTNVFAVVDLITILPWYCHEFLGVVYVNLQWLRIIRILRALPYIPWGGIIESSAPLLFAGGFAGFTVWIICASLYYMFERDNPLMMYSPVGDDPGPNDPQWNNFHSIPAAMYFSLVNFFGEFPLIDQHSTGGRFVGMFIQVVGAAVMAIPAGALGQAFGDSLDDGDDDEDGEGGDDAAGADKAEDAEPSPEEPDNRSEWERCLDGETDVKKLPESAGEYGMDAGDFLRLFVCILSLSSVAHFVLASLKVFPGNLETTVAYLKFADHAASIWLLAEYIYRLKAAMTGPGGLFSYMFSTLGFIDMLAVVPWLGLIWPANDWIIASASLRILKLERFVGAFSLFWTIMCKQSSAFLATGTLAMVCWLLFSTLMYFAERHNPDPDMQRYYSSVFVSMWMTLLNLTGEVPVCQYTVPGKLLSGFMGLFAVGFISIPMGLLGGAFGDEVEDTGDDDEPEDAGDADADEGGGEGVANDKVLTKRQTVFKFLAGSGDNQIDDWNPWEARAVRFEQFVICMILASAVVATVEANGPNDAGTSDSWQQAAFEASITLLFTVEYVLRFYAAPENPKWTDEGYVSDRASRFAFVTSWPSLIDLLAITPYYFSLAGSNLADKYDGQLRMLRIFRLLTLDKYIPSVSLISAVVTTKAAQFKMAGYAMMSLWAIFATLLWLTERNDDFQIDDLLQKQRYGTLISALPYTLVHLTGDYPLVDYTLHAKICLFFALVFAVGVVGVPAGLLADGFSTELKARRERDKKNAAKSRSSSEKIIKGWVQRWKLKRLVSSVEKDAIAQKAKEEEVAKNRNCKWRAHEFLDGLTMEGRIWSKFMMLLIVLNVLSVMLETVEYFAVYQKFWDMFELVSVVIFTVMYIAHIWVADVDANFKYNRWNYVKSFWGVVDFITVAPYWMQIVMVKVNIGAAFAKHAFIFRVFRVLRVLQAEDYIESFTLLDDAWYSCRDSMIACGFMAMMVWVCGSVLFYNFEAGNPRMSGAFDSLGSSMYYSMIFLGGEWGLIDFTPMGQVVCVFYCIIGIALYGIPVGAVFEAFGTVLSDRKAIKAEQEKREAEAESESDEAAACLWTDAAIDILTKDGRFDEYDQPEANTGTDKAMVTASHKQKLNEHYGGIAGALKAKMIEKDPFWKVWIVFDTDGSGSLSVKEIGDVMRDLGMSSSDETIQAMVDEADEDRSGSIEFGEFKRMLGKNATTEDTSNVVNAFKSLDRDGDGSMSAKELRHVMSNLGESLTPEEVDDMTVFVKGMMKQAADADRKAADEKKAEEAKARTAPAPQAAAEP